MKKFQMSNLQDLPMGASGHMKINLKRNEKFEPGKLVRNSSHGSSLKSLRRDGKGKNSYNDLPDVIEDDGRYENQSAERGLGARSRKSRVSLNINVGKRPYHNGSSNNLFLDQDQEYGGQGLSTEEGGSPHLMSPHLNPNLISNNAAVINLQKVNI